MNSSGRSAYEEIIGETVVVIGIVLVWHWLRFGKTTHSRSWRFAGRRIEVQLPTPDMLSKVLPDGVLDEGGV